MTQRSTQSRAVSRCAALRFGVLGLGLAVAVLGGCAAQKKTKAQSFPWATVKSVRPVLPSIVTPSPDTTVSDFLPEFELEAPPPPSPVAEIQSMPQRPRVAATPPGPSNTARPEASPDCSSVDRARGSGGRAANQCEFEHCGAQHRSLARQVAESHAIRPRLEGAQLRHRSARGSPLGRLDTRKQRREESASPLRRASSIAMKLYRNS